MVVPPDSRAAELWYFQVHGSVNFTCLITIYLPDNDRATLWRWDPWTKLLQIQYVSRCELVGNMGLKPSQPAVIWWRWGSPTYRACPFQTNAFSTLHHGTQLQHQGVSDQLLWSALARHLRLQWEHSRPGEHLRERKRYGYSRLYLISFHYLSFICYHLCLKHIVCSH